MKCPHCNVEIENKTTICPICHKTLDNNPETYESYPRKTANRHNKIFRPSAFSFTQIYFLCSFIICVIAGFANLYLFKDINWHVFIVLIALYAYLLVKNTILSNTTFSIKVFYQAVMFIILVFVIQDNVNDYLKNKNPVLWALEYAFPAIIIISILIIDIVSIAMIKKDFSCLTSAVLYPIFSIIPIILYAFRVINNLYMPLITLGIGLLSTILTLIFGGKRLINEFKRKYHI